MWEEKKIEQIHKCNFPEERLSAANLGDVWLCDGSSCNKRYIVVNREVANMVAFPTLVPLRPWHLEFWKSISW